MDLVVDPVIVRSVRDGERHLVLNLIAPFVVQQKLLPRTVDELDALIPNGFIAEVKGQMVGFATLEVYSKKLAEVRSLVVAEAYQGQGIGKRLVEACVQRARDRNILEVMAISSSEQFFRACGFDYTLPGEKKAFFLQTGTIPASHAPPRPDSAT